jgi:hypothetical protein
VPLEILDREQDEGATPAAVLRTIRFLDRGGRAAWPSLFAYQYVAVLSRDPARTGTDDHGADAHGPVA